METAVRLPAVPLYPPCLPSCLSRLPSYFRYPNYLDAHTHTPALTQPRKAQDTDFFKVLFMLKLCLVPMEPQVIKHVGKGTGNAFPVTCHSQVEQVSDFSWAELHLAAQPIAMSHTTACSWLVKGLSLIHI